MIVNLVRRIGNTMIREPLEEGVMFEGGEAQEGVLVTFTVDGREAKGRVIHLSESAPGEAPGSGPLIEIEEIDQEAQDAASERVLAELPARSDFDPKI
jgi:hypothetical protein